MATKVTADFLNMNEKPLVDTSVNALEFYEHQIANPDTDSNPRFHIDYTDQYILPSEAYLQLTGEIVKSADGASYTAEKVAFVNNGPLHMFDSATYKINNQVVERVDSPGEATLMMSLVDYSNDYIDSMGEQLMIAKDAGANDTADTNTGFVKRKAHKKFDLCIPLKHIFGFAKDVNKVLYGMTHTVELVKRNSFSNALLKATSVDEAKVKLTGLSLWMPRITPSPEAEAGLLKFMESNKEINTPFQQVKYFYKEFNDIKDVTWDITQFSKTDRPRHVFVGFRKTDKENNQEQNNAVYEPCAVTDISLVVNGDTYPRFPYSIDFANKKVGRVYRDLLSYRGIDNKYDTGMLITKSDFLDRYPVYHFDLERMPEMLNDSASMIRLKAKLNAGAAYNAHVVVLADRELSFTGDGKRMNVNLR